MKPSSPPIDLSPRTSDLPPFATVVDAVRTRAAADPARTAVIDAAGDLSYADLLAAAEALADRLIRSGAGAGSRIGLSVDRSRDLVVGMLGIMGAGGSVVPLDVTATERLAGLLDRAGIDLVVGTDLPADAAGRVELIDPGTGPDSGAGPDPGSRAASERPAPTADDEAYLLFTSGSTGAPKGVRIGHRSLIAFAWSYGRICGIGRHTRGLLFAAPTFDVVMMELFLPLVHGGTVVVAGAGERQDPVLLQRFCRDHRVTFGSLPVALLPLLEPDSLPDWLVLDTGAEPPGPEQVRRWTGGPVARRFLNSYGPTETTICVTAYEAVGSHRTPLPIGRPLPNQCVMIAHPAVASGSPVAPVAPGEVGEIVLAGTGLALGYLDDEQRPSGFTVTADGTRVYRTGDLGRVDADGLLHFCGRVDRQVKIRGHRVELAEIEAVASAHPGVGSAQVTVQRSVNESVLHLWYTGNAAVDEMRDWVAARVIAAVRPAQVHRLDSMPLLPSGKIDRAALSGSADPAPGPAPAVTEPPGPSSAAPAAGQDLGELVAAAWTRATGSAPAPGVGFYAAGGTSVSAMYLCDHLFQRSGRRIPTSAVLVADDADEVLRRLIEQPIDADADAESGVDTDVEPGVDEGSAAGAVPPALTAPQYRHWLGLQLLGAQAGSVIQVVRRLTGPLDTAALATALADVINHHDILRLRVRAVDGRPIPEITGRVELSAGDLLADRYPDGLQAQLTADVAAGFDPATGPLWRARLLPTSGGDQVLVLSFDHLVMDGWSIDTVLSDLAAAYRARVAGTAAVLEPQPPFAAHAVAERKRHGATGERDLDWWETELAGVPLPLPLPGGSEDQAVRPPDPPTAPRPPAQAVQSVQRTRSGIMPALTAVARSENTGVPALLAAAVAGWLADTAGADDLILGLADSGREDPRFRRTVGMFVDVFPLRWRRDRAATRTLALAQAARGIRSIGEHRGTSLSDITRRLRTAGKAGRHDPVQVLLNIYNFTERALDLPGIVEQDIEPPVGGAPFDLTVYLRPQPDGALTVQLACSASRFAPGALATMVDQLAEALLGWAAPEAGSAATEQLRPVPSPEPEQEPEPAGRPGDIGAAGHAHPFGRRAVLTQPPRTPTEAAVQGIWADVLQIEPPGVTANFFDVGGYSAAVPVIRERINARLGSQLSLVDLFGFPNIRALADHVDAQAAGPPARTTPGRGGARRRTARRQRPVGRTAADRKDGQ